MAGRVCGGELPGNFPQAFTHIRLVSAAWAVARAEQAPPSVSGAGLLTGMREHRTWGPPPSSRRKEDVSRE
jgi:hypothetical protein